MIILLSLFYCWLDRIIMFVFRLDGSDANTGVSPRVTNSNQLVPPSITNQPATPGAGLSRASSSAANVFSGHLTAHLPHLNVAVCCHYLFPRML